MLHRHIHWVVVCAVICVVFCSLRPALSEDCNGNGVSDDQDITAGTSEDCNLNGIPDECEAYPEGDLIPTDSVKGGLLGEAVALLV